MEYRTLGRSGCAVSTLCLGTMTFGAEADERVSQQQLDRFVEAGGTLVDTADVYAQTESERIIGRWFADRPADVTDRVVLATKGRFPTADDPNGVGLSARHLSRALDASLSRLGVDAVDLYQAHSFDPITPLDETLRSLDGFVRSGKIRYYGFSNFTGARTLEQLDTNLKAAGLHLTDAETETLDQASDLHPADYPYGAMGVDQRSRKV